MTKEIKGLKNKIDHGAKIHKRMKDDKKELDILKIFLKEKAKKKKVKLMMGHNSVVTFTKGTKSEVEFEKLWTEAIGNIMESFCEDLETTTVKSRIDDMINLVYEYNEIIRNKIGSLVKADITAMRDAKMENIIEEEDIPYKSVSFKIQ